MIQLFCKAPNIKNLLECEKGYIAMRHNFKKIICTLMCLTFVFSLLSIAVSADTGPKPSVRITFENMGDELCYATLLSKAPGEGPNSVWDGNDDHISNYEGIELDIWRAFADYKDSDGYYFLQRTWMVNEDKEFTWGYYPPDTFKILLYYPQTERFVVSGICERYAFDTYYTVDMNGVDIDSVTSGNDGIDAYRSYQWRDEVISLIARILITLVIEMSVALLFGFGVKKAFAFLAIVNATTQIVLNVLLNIINFNSGQRAFLVGYILLELIVIAIEAVIYSTFMKKFTDKSKPIWLYVLYAFVANTVSFGVGIAVANILPGIF